MANAIGFITYTIIHPRGCSGDGTIDGTISIGATPVGAGYKVELYNHRSGELINRTFTDTSGNYEFTLLDTSCYFRVVCLDHTETYNMVAKDLVQAT